jgi:hypothetical protein
VIDPDTLEGTPLTGTHAPPGPELIDYIPDPDTVRGWLADSVRRTDLLRSLLRLARRKESYKRPALRQEEEAGRCRA